LLYFQTASGRKKRQIRGPGPGPGPSGSSALVAPDFQNERNLFKKLHAVAPDFQNEATFLKNYMQLNEQDRMLIGHQ